MSVLYSMPTQEMADLIMKSKFDRLVEQNPIFKSQVRGSLRVKEIGEKMFYSMYTYGTGNALSYSVDMAIYDEVSRSNPEAINMFSSRMLESPYQWEWFVSNPDLVDDRMHQEFKKSDQKSWAVKCSKCNHWQILDFFENVCREEKTIKCQKCKNRLSDEDRINGQWVAKFENREVSGYHIHQLMRGVSGDFLAKQMLDKEEEDLKALYNTYLGLPYAGSDINVNSSLIKNHLIEPTQYKENVVMGVDVGASENSSGGHHYVIGTDNVIWKLGIAKDLDEIAELIKEYNVKFCVIDNGPEYEGAKKLQAKFPQVVMRCVYVGSKRDKLIEADEVEGQMKVARHLYFDKIIQDLAKGKYTFAFRRSDMMLDKFCDQFATMNCLTTTDRFGNIDLAWESPSGKDHFANAFLYYTVALERMKQTQPLYQPVAKDKKKVKQQDGLGFFDIEKPSDNWLNL